MQIDKLTSFEQSTLNRFLLNHMGMETRGKLIAELPVVYRKLLGRPDSDKFREKIKGAVLEDTPCLCACGQLYSGEGQYRECVKTEALRDAEEFEDAEEVDRVETILENLEEDE